MSKAYLNFCKKNNPLASVLNKRAVSPNLTSRSTIQKDNSLIENDPHTKLYTFCSSSNKHPVEESVTDENKSSMNVAVRERKVSLNNLKGKVQEPGRKSNTKGNSNQIKDKKTFNNLSIASITTLNSAFERKKTDRPVTFRNEEKKINISVCINPKTVREFNDSKQKGRSQEKPKAFEQNNLNLLQKYRQSKNNTECEEQSSKIILSKDELEEITQKFAQEMFTKNQRISHLTKQIDQYQKHQQEFFQKMSIQQQSMQDFLRQIKESEEQMAKLKNKMKILLTDNEYYIMAKDEARNTIKEYQLDIASLNKEVQDLQEQLGRYKQCSLLSHSSKYEATELRNHLKLLQIQNNHLKNELQINDNFKNILKMPDPYQTFNSKHEDQLILKLSEQNFKLRSELKDLYLERIHSDIYQKTIEQCALRLTELQEENDMLRSKFKFSCLSIKESMKRSSFERRLDSSNKQSTGSPSEVECVIWKRDHPDHCLQHGTRDIQIGQFNYDFYSNFSHESQ